MSVIDVAVRALHSVTAATWAGSVLFVTFALLPSAVDGSLDAAPMRSVVSRFRWLSRGSSAVLFVTGGHLAGTLYTVERLTGETSGHLVLGMLVLWFVLTGLVEVSCGKLQRDFEEKKVRTPAQAARPFLQASSLVAVLLLVDAVLIVYGGGLF
ncbi:CopD family protein [Haloarchaeobius sp. HRN-SO-5]|uniref:CopD family protein n=1 Tax=Haloarchaeobius sp. HRN-SO-5 TaxID=3446118 RepID=UPI003EB9F3B5